MKTKHWVGIIIALVGATGIIIAAIITNRKKPDSPIISEPKDTIQRSSPSVSLGGDNTGIVTAGDNNNVVYKYNSDNNTYYIVQGKDTLNSMSCSLNYNWWISLPTEWQRILIDSKGLIYPIKDEELEKLNTLYALDFHGYSIDDLSPLCALPQLSYVNCSGTKITSIEPIRRLTVLKRFICDSVAITDINPLYDLKSLTFVRLESTNIPSDTIENFLLKRPEIKTQEPQDESAEGI